METKLEDQGPLTMRTAILITTLLLTAGCYSYNPLTTPSPEPGTSLAVTLTDAGSDELARSLGPGAFIVRGRYLSNDEQGMLLSVTSVETKRGYSNPWSGETVAVPDNAVASLDVRKLSKGRSFLLAGIGVGGLVVTTVAFSLIGGGTTPNSGGGLPPKQ
jgi:hypothetical protein